RDLYLSLLEKTLSFSLWDEPPAPVETFAFKRGPLQRWALGMASKVLAKRSLGLVELRKVNASEREEGRYWPGYAMTMIGPKRLANLRSCVETVLAERVPGDLIETGVWRGGACIFMKAILAAHGDTERRLFVADSFAGLPPPDAEKYPADKGDVFHTLSSYFAVSEGQVRDNFAKYGLLDERVVFLRGWFKDTLPHLPSDRLAVIRLDGDMYESTMDGLKNLYHKLSPGGFCVIDDYGLPTCAKAVDDFRKQQGISEELKTIDWTGRFWRKTSG
ncbi:MAG TPA: TylF/MycF family methyltransferase, partial [Polyangiaceae bacterium]|nr:TylF/MycF family methyltransferase [Polyangiaceae bacterium]